MKYPKVNVATGSTEKLEAQYICFLAKGISMGEYQNNGFVVTPTLEKGSTKSVHFPDLSYSKSFWTGINSNPNLNLSGKFSKTSIDEALMLLKDINYSKYEKDIEKIKSDWEKIEKDFFETVDKFLDFSKALNKVESIDVLITPFGTIGSFNPPRVGNKFKLLQTSRADMPEGNIAATILQNLYIIQTNIGGEIGDEKYLRRMATISFLFENSVFKKFYPEFKSIIKPDYNTTLELIEKSNKYLEKLGFSKKTVIDFTNPIFTEKESLLLEELINNQGKILTFEKCSEVLWGDESFEKFSLEAIAKVIENIRKKIRELGINKEVIFTKRSFGYMLVS